MTDKQQNKLLQDFANEHSISVGGCIKITITPHSIHYEPTKEGSMKYEDCVFLSQQLSGATSFLYWLRRTNRRLK